MDNKLTKYESFSFIVITYNQERYIESALKSVFKQDYQNYEVVISDDCSSDHTWENIKKTICNQNKKNIKIRLNRNNTNLGILQNFQKAISLSSCEWLVAMAGDDVSKSNRLQELNRLVNVEKGIFAVGTGYDTIDALGFIINKNIHCIKTNLDLPLYPGFTAAIHRDCYIKFPFITANLQSEDIVYTLRSLELGKILLSNVSTVKHRIHASNITAKGVSLESYIGKIRNHKKAIETLQYYKNNGLRNFLVKPLIDNQIKFFFKKIESYEIIINYLNLNFPRKIQGLFYFDELSFKQKIKFLIEADKILLFLFSFIVKFNNYFKRNKKLNTDFAIYDANGIVR